MKDKDGKEITRGDYVHYNGRYWEVFNSTDAETLIWIEPRCGNEFPAQWAYNDEIALTDIKQLHLKL